MSAAMAFAYENNKSMSNDIFPLLIVDMGHTCTTISLCHYTIVLFFIIQNKCEIIKVLYNTKLNGRTVDTHLISKITKEISTKHSLDCKIDKRKIRSLKNYIKILKECRKTKEKLSADGADIVYYFNIGEC